MTTLGALMLIPGLPLNVHVPAPNKIVTGLFAVSVALHVCPGAKPRASTVPPAAGSAPMAALICAHGSLCGKLEGFGMPFVVCTVSVVNVAAVRRDVTDRRRRRQICSASAAAVRVDVGFVGRVVWILRRRHRGRTAERLHSRDGLRVGQVHVVRIGPGARQELRRHVGRRPVCCGSRRWSWFASPAPPSTPGSWTRRSTCRSRDNTFPPAWLPRWAPGCAELSLRTQFHRQLAGGDRLPSAVVNAGPQDDHLALRGRSIGAIHRVCDLTQCQT